MSGRIKHMERSHKSRINNYSTFNSFKKSAFDRDFVKNTRVSLLDRVKKLFRKNQDK